MLLPAGAFALSCTQAVLHVVSQGVTGIEPKAMGVPRSQFARALRTCFTLPWPGPAGQQDDYVAAVTALFRDIAVAVEENEAFLRDNFGAPSIIDVVMGLQVSCRLVYGHTRPTSCSGTGQHWACTSEVKSPPACLCLTVA